MSNNLFSPLINALADIPYSLNRILYKLPNYVSYELPTKQYRIGDISIPIGKTKTNTIYLNIGQSNVHTLICGTTGTGKSNLIHSIVCSITQLYPTADLILYDWKAVELSIYKNMNNVKDYQYNSDNISNSLEQLYQSILFEYEQMLSNNKRCVSAYDKRTIVILEEISLCNRKIDIPILERMMSISRACGYHFILTSQRIDSNTVLSPIIRNLLDNVITFKLDTNTSKLILNNDSASLIDIVGRGIYKAQDKDMMFQSYHIKQDTIDTVINNNLKTENINKKEEINNTDVK
ncbi:MAG: DUF87 domain-containing protein, partial [Bacilli bacterium]|nr:DUF87 domain-containing protein [Bacilli bacterium]